MLGCNLFNCNTEMVGPVGAPPRLVLEGHVAGGGGGDDAAAAAAADTAAKPPLEKKGSTAEA